MLAVPELDNLDVAFGNVKHMPKWEVVPERFKRHGGTIHNQFISKWFFSGVSQAEISEWTAKPGIDRMKALAAIRAVLTSFEPKHEHKEAACAYMLSEWFDPPAQKKRA